MGSIVEFFHLHPVVINHPIGGHIPIFIADEREGELSSVQPLQLFGGGATTMQGQIVALSNLLQIGEVGDNSCLLAAEAQVDKVLDPTDPQLYGCRLELRRLLICEAVQPLCQIIQLV